MSEVISDWPVKVLFVISNLEYGGAQRQVVQLVNRLHASGCEAHVCSLSDYVPLESELRSGSRFFHIIEKQGRFDLKVVKRLRALLSELAPDVLHTFLFDAEIAGRLAARHIDGLVVIGSERNTDYKLKWRQSTALRLTNRMFDAIIANSNAGKRFQMRRLRVAEHRIFVVHNGVDTTTFAPREASGLRLELGIDEVANVIGMFCSFKKQKNHPMFFRMAKRVLEIDPHVRFVCVGEELHGGLQDSRAYRERMSAMIESMGLADAVICLGNRDDVAELYSVCDVTVLTSRREGTPNVLLESMACEVPVVATDVADNATIVPDGKVGHVVPLDDDNAMADKVISILEDQPARRRMGSAARTWVEEHYSMTNLKDNTLRVYREVLRRKGGAKIGCGRKEGASCAC